MSLKVQVKNVYGKEMIYPACEKSALLATLAKQKTFTHTEIQLLKQLGYSFEIVAPTMRGL